MLRYIGKSPLINILILFICIFLKYLKINSPIVDCFAFFYVGGLSAIAFHKYEKKKIRNLLKALALGFIVIVPIVVFNTSVHHLKYFEYLFMIIYLPILTYSAAEDILVNSAFRKIIEAMGNMTYSSYLIHFPIQLLIALYCNGTHQAIPYYNPIFFIGFITITLFFSYYIFCIFEMPTQVYIRNRFM